MIPQRKSLSSYEERSPLYEDVRSLLNPGFLSTTIEYNGIQVGIRTLNSDDIFLIEARTGMNQYTWFEWLLSTSIWLFDGQVLERNNDIIYWVRQKLLQMPKEFRNVLISANNILTKRFTRARDRALSYFYERESRDLWGSRGSRLFDNVFAWVGRNSVQDLWVYYNKMEDMRLQRVFDQNMAAFSASPHAPKSIKKINDKMKSDEDILEIERSIVQDRMYFNAFGIDFEDNRFLRQGYGNVEVAVTFEDLEEQYRNYLEGKKDRHDLAIEDARRRMLARKETKRKIQERIRQEMLQYRQEKIPDQEGPRMLIGEDAEEYMRKMQQESQKYRAGWVSEQDGSEPSFRKHIEQEVQRPSDIDSPVPDEVKQELLKMMSQNPNEGIDLSRDIRSHKPKLG